MSRKHFRGRFLKRNAEFFGFLARISELAAFVIGDLIGPTHSPAAIFA